MYQSDGLTNHERNQLDGLKRENDRLEQERRSKLKSNLNYKINSTFSLLLVIHTKLKKLMMENEQLDRSERSIQRFPAYSEEYFYFQSLNISFCDNE